MRMMVECRAGDLNARVGNRYGVVSKRSGIIKGCCAGVRRSGWRAVLRLWRTSPRFTNWCGKAGPGPSAGVGRHQGRHPEVQVTGRFSSPMPAMIGNMVVVSDPVKNEDRNALEGVEKTSGLMNRRHG